MKSLSELLKWTIEQNASDLHLTVGSVPVIRVNGHLIQVGEDKLTPADTEKYAREILDDSYEEYYNNGEIDTSYSIGGLGRFRVNVYKQRGSDAIAVRVVALKIPTLKQLELPEVVRALTTKQRGLVLVTGPTGSGKSTTLAAMVNEINLTRACNIITLEDPIEYLHKHNKSIINQREIGKDSKNYQNALRAILREDPDVILVGEMRDLETISIAITAAETGHLVFSTLHTIGAAKTVDRIVDVFPPYQQQQIKVQLAAVMQGIISQQLIPKITEKGRVAALEVMISTPAIQNLIREGKTHQLQSCVQTGGKYGMKTMDMSISDLYKRSVISKDDAITYSVDNEMMVRMLAL
ncbi:type IV pilus twitching motility protein PilT [Clostridium estertheticum]|uniref:type IV pilus twitching motility protein PilT n=1 Tax=Clostridium estertheticum TaxID=238834 RepID=UPI001CF1DC79|nr:type IV pilus twitching motility protein PilT [Clostridium estertheticum]MCB2306134.1 type IV pilus twitching motility protein PilT [Clostridium estertheticum]MCB2344307.1 type IV pilus twitching motility protein PilT [Clostridium estertheticum]MCB2349227.1 type IV pilus twitching motility protein PilT [Clostridium estertheticum]WAG44975.1 type IV pilus twitching motility protein PilT [Clostridium estertheticum]